MKQVLLLSVFCEQKLDEKWVSFMSLSKIIKMHNMKKGFEPNAFRELKPQVAEQWDLWSKAKL